MLTAVAMAALLALAPPTGGSDSPPSGGAGGWQSAYVTDDGSQVDVSAGDSTQGTPSQRPPSTSPGASAPAPPPRDCGILNRCNDYAVALPPDLTLEDLASFRPAPPTLGGEPAGFGVVGMPTNLLATASEQRMPGTVLGWDLTVRFVPTAFVFDNGDGTTTRAASGGASWASLGQGQFTPTATSHVYQARGTYAVGVTVEYAASVDFGSGTWRTVPGVVRAQGGGYDVRVVEVRTALVDRTCVEDPAGPGC
ncbi:hypothetical protein ACFT30_14740 [Microbacterium ureisolvens]|uniref:hypothetical protein n=1 Tax=Microbacterium ureisolvens TaxID=2781186 RepID=UPI003625D27C